MNLFDLASLVLATWWMTYQIVFGFVLEPLRGRAGIGYDLDDKGNEVDRWAAHYAGEMLNCYACTATFAGLLVYVLWWAGGELLVDFLAVLGAVQLVGRWHISQRPRKEWWL